MPLLILACSPFLDVGQSSRGVPPLQLYSRESRGLFCFVFHLPNVGYPYCRLDYDKKNVWVIFFVAGLGVSASTFFTNTGVASHRVVREISGIGQSNISIPPVAPHGFRAGGRVFSLLTLKCFVLPLISKNSNVG
jgi:hypothetical protein